MPQHQRDTLLRVGLSSTPCHVPSVLSLEPAAAAAAAERSAAAAAAAAVTDPLLTPCRSEGSSSVCSQALQHGSTVPAGCKDDGHIYMYVYDNSATPLTKYHLGSGRRTRVQWYTFEPVFSLGFGRWALAMGTQCGLGSATEMNKPHMSPAAALHLGCATGAPAVEQPLLASSHLALQIRSWSGPGVILNRHPSMSF